MQRIASLLLAVCAFMMFGCESSQIVKDSWKFTKRQYHDYLNTPASLDLDDKGSCEVYELALGEAVMQIDAELEKLVRTMENSDHNPDENWVMYMFRRLPWLSGVALVDGEGNVVARFPEYGKEDFNPGPMIEPDPKQRLGALRGHVQIMKDGAEVYVGNPVYSGEELRGLVIAYFDPATLATMSRDPGSFVMASPAGIIWPGRYGGGALAGEDWAELLTQKSCGIVGKGDSAFFWTTRYLGNLPIVYGMPVSAAPTQVPAADGEPSAPAAPTAVVQPGAAGNGASAPADGQGMAPVDAATPSEPLQEQPVQTPEAGDARPAETQGAQPQGLEGFGRLENRPPAEKPAGEAADAPEKTPKDATPTQDPWQEPPGENPAVVDTPGGN